LTVALALSAMAPTVGIVGLGLMGGNMATHLLDNGYAVHGCDVDPDKVDSFEADGGVAHDSPADLVSAVSVVITSLPDPAVVEEVYLGETGLLAGDPEDVVALEMSTIDPETTLTIHEGLAGTGLDMLGAPVSGGPEGAADGTLTVMVGGDESTFEREAVRTVLDAVGSKVYHTGGVDSGHTVKLLNNTMSMGNLVLAMEAVSLGAARGVDGEVMLEVLSNAGGSSNQLEKRLPRVLNRNFEAGFAVDYAKKDVGLALETAEQMNRPMFVAPLVHAMYTRASAEGRGAEDVSATVKCYEDAQDALVEATEHVDEHYEGY
jgi:3-hydroxyisobutyrate dehydrogenase-like beta-hydroxyacid dehydrogenase